MECSSWSPLRCPRNGDTAVHGKTSTPHTEECRNRIGEQMEHDPEVHESLQFHKHRRDVELEIEANQALVARENEGPQERQDVEMAVSVAILAQATDLPRQWLCVVSPDGP